MTRQIHTQGDFDGACFLYAIANAYTALTKSRPKYKDWDSGIGKIPHPVDFLRGCSGGTTQNYAKESALLGKAVDAMLTEISTSEFLLQGRAAIRCRGHRRGFQSCHGQIGRNFLVQGRNGLR